MASKVSFTVRRPTPISRDSSDTPDPLQGSLNRPSNLPPHIRNDSAPRLGSPLARSSVTTPAAADEDEDDHIPYQKDSSDEDSAAEDELVTGFDKFGVQRLNGTKKVEKPLVIPALKNKDWRELARKRRGATSYVPPSAAAVTGADGSVGGLGTRDSINSGPVLSGLQVKTRTVSQDDDEMMKVEQEEDVKMEVVEETEDQRALRAILAESSGEVHHDGPVIDIIPTPISETDALRQDVDELPEAATLEDYARVPVSQFGAALLRGMGWKEGTAATRKPGKGLIEPYLPAARPALLGIGAKEQEVYDDGSKKKNNGNKRPERRYMPVVKQERGGSGSGSGSPVPTPNDGSSRAYRRDRSRSPRQSAPSSRRESPDRYKERGGGDGRRSRQAYDDGRDRHVDKRRTEDRDRRRNDDERDRRRNEEQRDRRRNDDDRDIRRRDDGRDMRRDNGRDKERDRRDRDRRDRDRRDRDRRDRDRYDNDKSDGRK